MAMSPNCSISTVTAPGSVLESITTNDNMEHEIKLFEGSNKSSQDVKILTELFCSHFHLPDEGSTSLYSLIRTVLPEGNSFPTGRSYIQGLKKDFPIN